MKHLQRRYVPADFEAVDAQCLKGHDRPVLPRCLSFNRNTESLETLGSSFRHYAPSRAPVENGRGRHPCCPWPQSAPMCIMVVDDEVLVRMATADTLRDAGFTVI